MFRLNRIILGIALTLACLAAPATALAGWDLEMIGPFTGSGVQSGYDWDGVFGVEDVTLDSADNLIVSMPNGPDAYYKDLLIKTPSGWGVTPLSRDWNEELGFVAVDVDTNGYVNAAWLNWGDEVHFLQLEVSNGLVTATRIREMVASLGASNTDDVDLVMDSNGDAHIVYAHWYTPNHLLKHIFVDIENGAVVGKTTQTVADFGTNVDDMPGWCKVELDASDRPIISYASDKVVGIVQWTGSTWMVPTPENITTDHHVTHLSFTLDGNDTPHILWREEDGYGPGAPYKLRYTRRPASSWVTETLRDSSSEPFVEAYLAIGPNNYPRVLYADWEYNQANIYRMPIAKYMAWNGSAWNSHTISGRGSQVAGMVSKGNGTPVAVLLNGGYVQIAQGKTANPASAAGWNLETPNDVLFTGTHFIGNNFHLTFDAAGRPFFSYRDTGVDYRDTSAIFHSQGRFAEKTAGIWNTHGFHTPRNLYPWHWNFSRFHTETDCVFGGASALHVVNANGSPKKAVWDTVTAEGLEYFKLDLTNGAITGTAIHKLVAQKGCCPSLNVDANDDPQLVFIRKSQTGPASDLVYAGWTGSDFQHNLIDNRGVYCDSALDGSGDLHITYSSYGSQSTLYYRKLEIAGGSISSTLQNMELSSGLGTGTPSIKLDSGGAAHIAFVEGVLPNRQIQYAKFTGLTFEIQTIAQGNFTGQAQLVLGPTDVPKVAYVNSSPNNELLLASLTGSSWVVEIVDDSSGEDFDAEYDPSGALHFVYGKNKGMWHASNASSTPSPPAKVAMIGPVGIIPDREPTISWKALGTALNYTIEVYKDSPTGSLHDSATVAGTSHQVAPLKHNTAYYARCRGVGAGGNGAWSKFMMFKYILAVPSSRAPVGKVIDAGDMSGNMPLLTWGAVGSAVSYVIEIYHTRISGVPMTTVGTTTQTYKIGVPLTDNIRYWWRVKAVDAGGDSSAWGNAWVMYSALAKPIPISAVAVGSNYSLVFKGSDGAPDYDVELYYLTTAGPPTYTTTEAHQPGLRQGVLAPIAGGNWGSRHYWRVRAHNATQTTGWSPYRAFIAQYPRVTALGPYNFVDDATPAYTYTEPYSGCWTHTEVKLGRTIVENIYANDGSAEATVALDPVKPYRWRIRAYYDSGAH